MANDMICRFIPRQKGCEPIQIINFVYEAKPQVHDGLRSIAAFRMHYVLEGEGRLHMPGQDVPIGRGDLFFALPSVPFAVEEVDHLCYMYIGYLGDRAREIMDQLQVGRTNCVFHDFEEIKGLWQEAMQVPNEVVEIRSESLLLYTFSQMGRRLYDVKPHVKQAANTALRIKKYIDENYCDAALSLEKISRALSYNPKYISTVFKQHFSMGIAKYLNTIRIQQACMLMEQGVTSIRDLALSCGFKDPLYFSKVFKGKMKVSPKSYIGGLSLEER